MNETEAKKAMLDFAIEVVETACSLQNSVIKVINGPLGDDEFVAAVKDQVDVLNKKTSDALWYKFDRLKRLAVSPDLVCMSLAEVGDLTSKAMDASMEGTKSIMTAINSLLLLSGIRSVPMDDIHEEKVGQA